MLHQQTPTGHLPPTPHGEPLEIAARRLSSRRGPSRIQRVPCRGMGTRGLSEALHYLLCKEASMSEQGWREFLAAEGVDDWVVLHGGATAVFRVPSLGAAAQLAEAVAQVPGLEGSGTLLTIADGRLSVRLTRGVFRLEERHIALARAVSAMARAHGAVADRAGAQEVSWRSLRSPTRSTSASGALSSGTRAWPTTTPSTRSVTARRSGCRTSTRPSRSGTRCTSTCPSLASRSRRAWRRPLPQEAASSTTPMPLRPGSSPTVPATACASLPGPTGPSGLFLVDTQ